MNLFLFSPGSVIFHSPKQQNILIEKASPGFTQPSTSENHFYFSQQGRVLMTSISSSSFRDELWELALALTHLWHSFIFRTHLQ